MPKFRSSFLAALKRDQLDNGLYLEQGLFFKKTSYISLTSSFTVEEKLIGCHINSLEHIIYNDNIDAFQNYIRDNPDFTYNYKCKTSYSILPIPLLNYTAMLNSLHCFQFIILNSNCYTKTNFDSAVSYAFQGGNNEIIKILEQKGADFSKALQYSVRYHRYELSDWVITNFSNQNLSIDLCIDSFNENAFLYANELQTVPCASALHSVFAKSLNIDQVRQIFKKEVDANFIKVSRLRNSESNESPIFVACCNQKINIECLSYLINANADVNYLNRPGYHPDIIPVQKRLNAAYNHSQNTEFPSLVALCFNQNITAEMLQIMITAGANPNKGAVFYLNRQTTTVYPLYALCLNPNANLEMVKILIDAGASIQVGKEKVHNYNRTNKTTVIAAALRNKKHNFEIINYLIEQYISAKIPLPLKTFCSNYSPDLIDLFPTFIKNQESDSSSSLNRLCKNPNAGIKEIKLLLDSNPKEPPSYMVSALFLACSRTNPELSIVKALVEHGQDINQLSGIDHLSPLSALFRDEHIPLDIFNYLLEQGADINIGSTTPLSFACQNPCINIDTVKLLLDRGADINGGEKKPLTNALMNPNCTVEFINFLIENGADVKNQDKHNAYLFAARKNPKLEIYKTLIDHGVDISFNPTLSSSLLTETILSGPDPEIIKYLIEKGANPNDGGMTPLYLACFENSLPLIKVLIENGADPNKISQTFKKERATPLICLMSFMGFKGTNIDAISYLLEHGADPNLKIDEYPLEIACKSIKVSIPLLSALLSHGANPCLGRAQSYLSLNSRATEEMKQLLETAIKQKSK